MKGDFPMKKNSIKNVILIVAFLVSIFVLGFKSVQYRFFNNIKANDKNSKLSASKSPVAIKASENKDKIKDEAQPKTVYSILGNSNKLSSKEKANRDAWIAQVVELANKNIDTLFINGFTKEKKVCLTFDDGPDLAATPKVLAILKENNIKGSFFFIGENVRLYPNIVKEAYNSGNLVLCHSYSHPEFTKLKEEDINKQLEKTENEIYKVIGKKPAIIRPPYGDINQNTIDILSKANYKTVLWSIDTLDWSQREKTNIVNNVINNIRPGDIILMHTGKDKEASIDALPEIIANLKEMGYSFTTIDELLNINAYK